MKPETRSKDSDRKWVLFVSCGTGYLIKPVYVRDIRLQGLWAAGKRIHKYGDTLWHDNKSYVIMLFLTGTALQTKHRKQTEHTCKEARTHVQKQMYKVNRLKKCLFPIHVLVRASTPGVSYPVGRFSSTTAGTLHTWDTSLFSGHKVWWHKTKGRTQ